jgi:hypothetical protein
MADLRLGAGWYADRNPDGARPGAEPLATMSISA